MPQLKHTKPCNQCPWRRKSAPGWLGNSNPEAFLRTTLSETEMPCHAAIDYEDENWKRDQYPDAPLCAGSLVFFKNQFKLPRDPTLAKAVAQVEQDPDVFQFGPEFLEHHSWETTDE